MSAATAIEPGRRWGAEELLALVLDEGSWQPWDRPIDISGHDAAYQRELRAARDKAGTDESVITGRGLVRGRPVAAGAVRALHVRHPGRSGRGRSQTA